MDLILIFLFYAVTGAPLVALNREWLRINRLWLTPFWAATLGLVYFSMTQLLLGYVGYPLVGRSAMMIKLAIILLPYLVWVYRSYIHPKRSKFIPPEGYSIKPNWVDMLFLMVAMTVFGALVIILVHNYIPRYDDYKIWLVNIKYIWSTGYLRDNLDILDFHATYGSFYSIPAVNYLEFKGDMFEGRLPFITCLYGLLFFGIVWERLVNQPTSIRLVGLFVSAIVLLSYTNGFIQVMYTSYAELPIAFFIFLYITLLINDSSDSRFYLVKTLLMVVVLYILFIGKNNFDVIILMLLFFTGFYLYKKKVKSIWLKELKEIGWLPLVSILLILTFLTCLHFDYFGTLESTHANDLNHSRLVSKRIAKFDLWRMLELSWLAIQYYWTLFVGLLSCLMLASWKSRKVYLVLGLVLGLVGMFVVAYNNPALVVKIKNESYYRYVSHSFMLIPLLLLIVRKNISKWLMYTMALVTAGLFIYHFQNHVVSESAKFTSKKNGRIEDITRFNLDIPFEMAAQAEEVLDEKDSIVFIDAGSNPNINEIITEYLLLPYRTGGETKMFNYLKKLAANKVDKRYSHVVGFDFTSKHIQKLVPSYTSSSSGDKFRIVVIKLNDVGEHELLKTYQ